MMTDTNRRRNSAQEHVQAAIEDLAAIVVSQRDGDLDYKEIYLHRLKLAFDRLLEVRDLMDARKTFAPSAPAPTSNIPP